MVLIIIVCLIAVLPTRKNKMLQMSSNWEIFIELLLLL